MEHLVDHDWHGYTQGWGRWGDGEGACPVETLIGTCYVEQGDRDCSSAVISSYEAAGIGCGGATYTGDMKSCMLSTGNFRAHRMSDGYNCDDGYIAQRGDCYLNEVYHTAMCLNDSPDTLAEFSCNEFGGITGGSVGDQTGYESARGGYYAFPWDWCLEVIVDGDESKPVPATGAKYRVSTDPSGSKWFAEMVDHYDTGGSTDDFAGDAVNAIRWFACDAPKYRAKTQRAGWLPWVTQYNTGDLKDGCAGDGSPITAIEIESSSYRYSVCTVLPNGESVWFSEMVGQKDTGGSDDTFAGDGWSPIVAISMRKE